MAGGWSCVLYWEGISGHMDQWGRGRIKREGRNKAKRCDCLTCIPLGGDLWVGGSESVNWRPD